FPLGRFACVTGVSGSGKSSLVNDILYKALARDLNGATVPQPGRHARISGKQHLDKVIAIDQSPIGRTPRSNPATYIKVFDEIRALFTRLPDAKLRGYKPGRFSFNVPVHRGGGRCEACEGNGANRIEMDFLADVWVTCPVCEGRRFGRETLGVRFKSLSISNVLELEVHEALRHFENVPRVRAMLETLDDVGLDYIKLGQPSTTLSGGEAQRIKLARELVKRSTGRTLYVLDEPTTGLHFADIRKLLAVLHGFVDAGNTVVVIEHNLDVIKTADWVIDLGPEGGEAGGYIVAEGTPEEVAACEASDTGKALRAVLRASDELRVTSYELKNSRVEQTGEAAPNSELVTRNSELDFVRVSGARQHNLKDLTVAFPRNRMTVCTGVSGSGKTSFAIDTVFTEGYRRYVESLSAYARQFLGQLAKPRVEHVEGLSPAICIEQRAAARSPRSTVGTVTEIFDYMRVLWARVGVRCCPRCDVPMGTQTADEIVARVMALPEGAPISVLAPVTLGDGETYAGLFNRLKASGYTRVRIDGEIRLTAEATTLDARRKHRVEVVVDRTVVRARSRGRIAESVEHALALGNGVMVLLVEEVETVQEPAEGAVEKWESGEVGKEESPSSEDLPTSPPPLVTTTPAREHLFSQKLVCTQCGTSYEELGPNHFSFNSHLGWCETCEGLGVQRGAPAGEIIKHPERSLFDGAIAGWHKIDRRTPLGRMLTALCAQLGVRPDTPLEDWSPEQKRALLFGTSGAGAARHGSAGSTPGQRAGAGRPAGASRDADWIDAPPFAGVRFQWRGFFPAIDNATRNSWLFRYKLRNTVTDIPCVTCRGGRLRPDAAAVRLGDGAAGKTIVEICELPLSEAAAFFRDLKLDPRARKIAGELLKEVRDRLQVLIDVGLEYLTLHRAGPTLSGGEAQRIRLASQIGSGLSGVLYVLDEPTIGLHPRDTDRLIRALLKLRDLGNTLLLVEHDRDVIRRADRLLDFGPRAGAAGGRVVAEGPPAEFLWKGRRDGGTKGRSEGEAAVEPATAIESPESEIQNPKSKIENPPGDSLTRAYLRGDACIPIPSNRRPVAPWSEPPAQTAKRGTRRPTRAQPPIENQESKIENPPSWLVVRGARQNNLKNIDVPIPLARLVCVTGVSGSGKSSLVNDILWPALANALNHANLSVGEHSGLEIIEPDRARRPFPSTSRRARGPIDKVINVDQSPIGNTPSSNPATYTGVFDQIRELFARLPDSKMRGYTTNRFSFNRPGGRCEACEGYGQRCIEMHFMPDVWVECETCRGRRYNPETLEVRFKGKNIADVLELSVAQALELFANVPRVRRMLQTLADVGLAYVQLGQPAPTLSGGEAQRVKLAAELGKPDTGQTLYILDEPTTGLHFDDIRKLLAVMHRLADLGNTVLVVEHNLDVLKCADWIIDLGPEAGDGGGWIVAAGTPEAITNYELRVTSSPIRNRTSGELGSQNPDFATRSSEPLTRNSELGTRNSELVTPSHTARALAPILAAGPYAERPRFDARRHAAHELEAARRGFGDVGSEVRMPWQVDGRKWHLEQRSSRADQPRHWEPAALEFVLDLVHAEGRRVFGKPRRVGARPASSRAGAPAQPERVGADQPERVPDSIFAPTNWNNRASVEVTAPGAAHWFLHALTGGEWLLELYFRAPPGTFRPRALDAQLDLKPLDQRPDIQAYGDWPRVDVRERRDGLDAVVVYVHDQAEIDTRGFRQFVRDAVSAYAAEIPVGG
ncbi:MAG: ATP-binding cassette domain-containing protein, partial [Planctomycetota bacterium]